MEAYERYGRALRRKATRILGSADDANDVVQALFMDLLGKRDERDVPLDLPYLYRAVTNRCLTLLRDESNRARLLERNDGALAPSLRTACEERTITLDLLAKLVRELDPEHCEVLAYRYLDDMTQDEIATLLDLSRKTIGHRLDRIREAVVRIAGSEPAAQAKPGGTP
jgi:RNA polymerase sigma factor (sigma-70 family)